ncbi:MAG TPA: lysine biosynthesis protein LysX [Candidatus Bathyarchaeota archaeon]|nr:lysine biosynthesis protein LysX [Candidatus Bathyarchaeota archaeon]
MSQIGLVYDRIRWEEKALIDASRKLGLEIKLTDSKKVYLDATEEAEKARKEFGDLVIQRCISYFRGLHITAILESSGLQVINPFHVSLICGNKLFTILALAKARLPVPKTLVAFTNEGAIKALETLGYPAVLKPVVGSWGRLVALIKDRETAQALIEARKEMQNALLQIYYLQEYVKRPPRDIRLLTVGNEVVAAAYRYSAKGDWRTNVARGGKMEPCPITNELAELALKASEAVGGGVLAIDCMESPEGIVVHEINNTPEFKGLYSATKINVPKKIIEYAVEALKK